METWEHAQKLLEKKTCTTCLYSHQDIDGKCYYLLDELLKRNWKITEENDGSFSLNRLFTESQKIIIKQPEEMTCNFWTKYSRVY